MHSILDPHELDESIHNFLQRKFEKYPDIHDTTQQKNRSLLTKLYENRYIKKFTELHNGDYMRQHSMPGYITKNA